MSDVADWIAEALGARPRRLELYERALSHSSASGESYERLEFLGDRVLGLVVASWLFERFGGEPEGKLSRRFNALVARETCAEVGRAIGVPERVRLGRQAREDNTESSDNVIGDVVEALLGALYLDCGIEAAEAAVRRHWAPFLEGQGRAPQHPKSALQELAAARGLKAPDYQVTGRSGPHHAPCFTIRVEVPGLGHAEAQGTSKQEAEKAAAAALLERVQ